MNFLLRIIMFVIGYSIAVLFVVYSIRWEDLPVVSMIGIDVTKWFIAILFVLVTFISGSMLTSSLKGKWSFDS